MRCQLGPSLTSQRDEMVCKPRRAFIHTHTFSATCSSSILRQNDSSDSFCCSSGGHLDLVEKASKAAGVPVPRLNQRNRPPKPCLVNCLAKGKLAWTRSQPDGTQPAARHSLLSEPWNFKQEVGPQVSGHQEQKSDASLCVCRSSIEFFASSGHYSKQGVWCWCCGTF